MRILSCGPIVVLGLIATSMLNTSCVSAYRKTLGQDVSQVFHRIYISDYNVAWQATLDALKSSRLDVSNREGGIVQTRWTENTAEKNFTESFGTAESYLKAQYRLRITLAKGFYNGKPSVKVTVQKEQMVQRDVLEGWRPIESDGIDENTLLYRVGRIIIMRNKIAKLEEEKTNSAINNTEF